MVNWLRQHKFEAHLFSFALMILASAGLYATIGANQAGWTWIFLVVYILANVTAMLIK